MEEKNNKIGKVKKTINISKEYFSNLYNETPKWILNTIPKIIDITGSFTTMIPIVNIAMMSSSRIMREKISSNKLEIKLRRVEEDFNKFTNDKIGIKNILDLRPDLRSAASSFIEQQLYSQEIDFELVLKILNEVKEDKLLSLNILPEDFLKMVLYLDQEHLNFIISMYKFDVISRFLDKQFHEGWSSSNWNLNKFYMEDVNISNFLSRWNKDNLSKLAFASNLRLNETKSIASLKFHNLNRFNLDINNKEILKKKWIDRYSTFMMIKIVEKNNFWETQIKTFSLSLYEGQGFIKIMPIQINTNNNIEKVRYRNNGMEFNSLTPQCIFLTQKLIEWKIIDKDKIIQEWIKDTGYQFKDPLGPTMYF